MSGNIHHGFVDLKPCFEMHPFDLLELKISVAIFFCSGVSCIFFNVFDTANCFVLFGFEAINFSSQYLFDL